MTARTVARERALDGEIREVTLRNIAKVTRFREGGEEALQKMVRAVETASGFEGKVDGEKEEMQRRRKGGRALEEVEEEAEEQENEDAYEDRLDDEEEVRPRREGRKRQIGEKPDTRKTARPMREVKGTAREY